MRSFLLTAILLVTTGLPAQTPCENGMVSGYPCNQISLYAVITPEDLSATEHNGLYINDVWGWTDPETGKEYVIVGLTDGVTFVDISQPSSPKVIGKLNEPPGAANRIARTEEVQHGKSTWRDMKVYNDHVFVVSDLNAAHGMQVFDLTRLRAYNGSTLEEFEEDARYDGISSAHNIVINEATGYAYIVGATDGSDCIGGGLHVLDISNPVEPVYTGCFDDDGYTHDGQCVIYEGPDPDYQGREICFNSNEDTFTIVDVEDKNEMTMISRTGYENAQYSHQGWLTEDHRFFLMNDEEDEFEFEFNPRTLIWNVEDLDQPVLIGTYFNEEIAVDHNLYIRDQLVYESNYLSGLRVLSTERIANGELKEIAFFDTYPDANAFQYGGAWSNYPFYESGIIAVSDMTNGLFLLKLDTTAQLITSHPEDVAVCEGSEISFAVNTPPANVTFQWQYFNGKRYLNLENGNAIKNATTNEVTLLALDNLVEAPIRCKITDESKRIFYSYPALFEFTDVLPDPDFSFQIEDLTITFMNNSQNADHYEWSFGDGATSTATDPVHEYESAGAYSVMLKAYNGCGVDSVTLSTAIVLGIQKHLSAIQVFPNPASEMTHLQTAVEVQAEIMTLSGQVIFQKQLHPGQHRLNLTNISPGVYLIRLTHQSNTQIRKIIIR